MSRCLAKIFGHLYEESRSLESQTSDLLPESQRSAARHGWQPLLPGGRPGSPVAGSGLGAGSPNSRSGESPPARSSASSRSVSSDAQRHRYRDYVIDIQAAIALLDPGQGRDCIAAVERHKALSQVSLRKRALQPSRSRRWTPRRMSAARSRPPPQCCGGNCGPAGTRGRRGVRRLPLLRLAGQGRRPRNRPPAPRTRAAAVDGRAPAPPGSPVAAGAGGNHHARPGRGGLRTPQSDCLWLRLMRVSALRRDPRAAHGTHRESRQRWQGWHARSLWARLGSNGPGLQQRVRRNGA